MAEKKPTLSPSLQRVLQAEGPGSALVHAVTFGKPSELKVILATGVDIAGDVGAKALCSAVSRSPSAFAQARSFAKILLDHGARDGPTGLHRQCALAVAVNRGFDECVELLLPHADPAHFKMVNHMGRTPLEEAEAFGQTRENIARMMRDELRSRVVKAEAAAISQAALDPQAASSPKPRL
jgi:hypothetical protein